MSERFIRSEALLGKEASEKLRAARVAVFGIGGVGSYAAEALARCGVGAIDLTDSDTVSESNINRQLIALSDTVGRYKTDVMAERIANISPDCKVKTHRVFYGEDTKEGFDFKNYDFIIDAVDSVTAKILLCTEAEKADVPIISCMGTGNKLDPTAFKVADIYKTSVCPLAKVMRHELRKRGIKHLHVVYSEEEPIKTELCDENGIKRSVPASVSFVPPVAGFILASEAVKSIISRK